jgi:hypothetical protein
MDTLWISRDQALLRLEFSNDCPNSFRANDHILNILHSVVARMMEEGTLAQDDVFETSLAIWAHAHGLITLYLSDRIKMPRMTFRDLYMRSLNRLVDGIRRGPSNTVNSI